jgi:hypothetical protein
VSNLKKEISQLDEFEQELDKHKSWIEQSIKNTTEDMQTRRYLYVNNEDLSKILYDDDTVLVLNAPINFTTLCYQVHYKAKILSYFDKSLSCRIRTM